MTLFMPIPLWGATYVLADCSKYLKIFLVFSLVIPFFKIYIEKNNTENDFMYE